MIEVTIEGLDKFMSICDPARFTKEMDKAVNRAAEAMRDDTKRMPAVSGPRDGYEARGIPLDTGRMRQAVQKRRLALLAAEVYVDTNYSKYVHDGTSRVPARPFFSWLLEDFQGLEKIDIILKEALERVANP